MVCYGIFWSGQLFGLHNWWSQVNFDDQAAEVLDPCFLEFSEFPEVMED